MNHRRLEKLRELLDRYGKQAELARAIGRSPSQVGQWLGGHRKLGDGSARNIEIKLGLPMGWLDTAPALRAAERPPPYNVALLPNWRDELVALAVGMSDAGRHELLSVARYLARAHPADKANTVS